MAHGIAYIDGLNLYHGIDEAGWRHCLWLDLVKLSRDLFAMKGHTLKRVRYFTAIVPPGHASQKDQAMWLKALRLQAAMIDIQRGKFKPRRCKLCVAGLPFNAEKGTDVALASWMVSDCLSGEAEASLLITGDSDQEPALELMKRHSSSFPLYLAFPPRRHSDDLLRVVGKANTFQLDEYTLLDCQMLPNLTPHVSKPPHWP